MQTYKIYISVYEGLSSFPVFQMSSDTKTVTALGVCWAGVGSAEPFVLGRQCIGIGMVGNDLLLIQCVTIGKTVPYSMPQFLLL